MSRLKSLEAFKFLCYVAIPIGMTAYFVFNQDNLEWIVRKKSYVVYPPEGPRPPNLEELLEIVKKNKEQRKQ